MALSVPCKQLIYRFTLVGGNIKLFRALVGDDFSCISLRMFTGRGVELTVPKLLGVARKNLSQVRLPELCLIIKISAPSEQVSSQPIASATTMWYYIVSNYLIEGHLVFMIEYRDIGWWYWLITACLLTLGVSGIENGLIGAIGLTVFQLIHFTIREHSITAFPVQVRFWYLLLLLIAFQEPLRLIFWIPLVGTWAQILFGYCAMARLVSLFPWNRDENLSFGLLKKTFLSRPIRGSVKQGFAEI